MCIRNRVLSLIYKILILVTCGMALLLHSGLLEDGLNVSAFGYYALLVTILCFFFYLVAVIRVVLDIKRRGTHGITAFGSHFKGALIMATGATTAIAIMIVTLLKGDSSAVASTANFASVLVTYVIPAMLLLDWMLFDRKGRWRASDPIVWLLIPYFYYAFVLVRAQFGILYLDGSSYPYYFINADTLGWSQVLINVGILTGIYVGIGFVLFFIDFGLGAIAKKKAHASQQEQPPTEAIAEEDHEQQLAERHTQRSTRPTLVDRNIPTEKQHSSSESAAYNQFDIFDDAGDTSKPSPSSYFGNTAQRLAQTTSQHSENSHHTPDPKHVFSAENISAPIFATHHASTSESDSSAQAKPFSHSQPIEPIHTVRTEYTGAHTGHTENNLNLQGRPLPMTATNRPISAEVTPPHTAKPIDSYFNIAPSPNSSVAGARVVPVPVPELTSVGAVISSSPGRVYQTASFPSIDPQNTHPAQQGQFKQSPHTVPGQPHTPDSEFEHIDAAITSPAQAYHTASFPPVDPQNAHPAQQGQFAQSTHTVLGQPHTPHSEFKHVDAAITSPAQVYQTASFSAVETQDTPQRSQFSSKAQAVAAAVPVPHPELVHPYAAPLSSQRFQVSHPDAPPSNERPVNSLYPDYQPRPHTAPRTQATAHPVDAGSYSSQQTINVAPALLEHEPTSSPQQTLPHEPAPAPLTHTNQFNASEREQAGQTSSPPPQNWQSTEVAPNAYSFPPPKQEATMSAPLDVEAQPMSPTSSAYSPAGGALFQPHSADTLSGRQSELFVPLGKQPQVPSGTAPHQPGMHGQPPASANNLGYGVKGEKVVVPGFGTGKIPPAPLPSEANAAPAYDTAHKTGKKE